MRVDVSKPGALADRLDPSMSSPAIEAVSVVADEDRSLASFADREVDGAGGSWDEGDHGGLVALAKDPQRAMASVEAEVADVGVACLTNPQPVEPE
jgi:hypothetical protein